MSFIFEILSLENVIESHIKKSLFYFLTHTTFVVKNWLNFYHRGEFTHVEIRILNGHETKVT